MGTPPIYEVFCKCGIIEVNILKIYWVYIERYLWSCTINYMLIFVCMILVCTVSVCMRDGGMKGKLVG